MASRIVVPALAGDLIGLLRRPLFAHLGDGEMGNIGPLFAELEHFRIQLAVQLTHARGAAVDPYKDGGGYRNERLHRSQGHFEGLFAAANALQQLHRVALAAVQGTRRQDGQVCCH